MKGNKSILILSFMLLSCILSVSDDFNVLVIQNSYLDQKAFENTSANMVQIILSSNILSEDLTYYLKANVKLEHLVVQCNSEDIEGEEVADMYDEHNAEEALLAIFKGISSAHSQLKQISIQECGKSFSSNLIREMYHVLAITEGISFDSMIVKFENEEDLEPTNPLDSFLFNEEKANIYIESLVLEFRNHLTVEKRANIMREIDVNQGTSKIFINSLTRKLSY